MKVSELTQFTNKELEQLTIRDIESDIQTILEKYQNSEIPLTFEMVQKLESIAELSPDLCKEKLLSARNFHDVAAGLHYLALLFNETGLSEPLKEAISAFLELFKS